MCAHLILHACMFVVLNCTYPDNKVLVSQNAQLFLHLMISNLTKIPRDYAANLLTKLTSWRYHFFSLYISSDFLPCISLRNKSCCENSPFVLASIIIYLRRGGLACSVQLPQSSRIWKHYFIAFLDWYGYCRFFRIPGMAKLIDMYSIRMMKLNFKGNDTTFLCES